MKKLFTALRQGKTEELKCILEKKPELVNSVSTPPPKKDMGQSLLQVAMKIGAFEIAYYFVEIGADINFMESEEEGSQWRTPLLHDAIRAVFGALCYNNPAESDEAFDFLRYLLKKGADPNKPDSNGNNAWAAAVSAAELVIERPGAYPDIQDFAINRCHEVLNLLIEFGVDYITWLDSNHMDQTNRFLYVDEFIPMEDYTNTYTYRGKTRTVVVKGDVDRTERMRKIVRKYYLESGQ